MLVDRQVILSALAGTWSLLNTSATVNGVSVPDEAYGTSPVGILIYTETGFMSAAVTSTDPEDRPEDILFPAQEGDADADWALVGKHSIGYAAPVEFDASSTTEGGLVRHGPITVANVPSMAGTIQERNFTLFEDGSVLRLMGVLEGGNGGELWWRRLD